MSLSNATNNNLFAIVSPIINFKTVGLTTFFTTPATMKFAPVMYQFICDSATAAGGDSFFNIGWTAADYDNYMSGVNFGPTTANFVSFQTQGPTPVAIFPASTIIRINVTSADTGTALTGRVAIYGIYV